MLDFDTTVKEDMDYYLGEGGIPFPEQTSPYYTRFIGFEYIGVQYFTQG